MSTAIKVVVSIAVICLAVFLSLYAITYKIITGPWHTVNHATYS